MPAIADGRIDRRAPDRFQAREIEASARRTSLLIAATAYAEVWRLHHDPSPPAEELKRVLIRLSGRQMKRGRPYTMPALLAGLRPLLAMLSLVEHLDLAQIRHLATQLPYLTPHGVV
jgi:hypothetical protein